MVYIVALILGLIMIYAFSRRTAFAGNAGKLSGTELNNVQELFFRTVFTLLGYVAKRDGPVNDKEVKRTETFMEKMDLDAKHKREAIRLFKSGADPQFNARQTIDSFKNLAKKSPNLAQILLVYLINLARVDGALVNKEVEAVEEIAFGLGYSNITFKHLLRMISSQHKFAEGLKAETSKTSDDKQSKNNQSSNQQGNNQQGSKQQTNNQRANAESKPQQDDDESCEEKTREFQQGSVDLQSAYEVLDIASTASNAEVKKAYRSMASQYHPDKLIGLGLPPYMVQAATECFKTIQAAYDYVQKARA